MDNAVILAGGQGKRMKADMPKPLFKVLGEPMLEWVIGACENSGIKDEITQYQKRIDIEKNSINI